MPGALWEGRLVDVRRPAPGWHIGTLVLAIATLAGVLPTQARALANFTWSGQAPNQSPFWSAKELEVAGHVAVGASR